MPTQIANEDSDDDLFKMSSEEIKKRVSTMSSEELKEFVEKLEAQFLSKYRLHCICPICGNSHYK